MATWTTNGIQCQFSNKNYIQNMWSFEAFKLIQDTKIHAANIEQLLKQTQIMKLSRQRLKNIHAQLVQQISRYEKILEPLNWRHVSQAAFINYLNLSPGSSRLARNIDNLFRDWCWGDKENEQAVQEIAKLVSPLAFNSQSHLLVLGSGAARLAYDLHRQFSLSKTYALDYNPLIQMMVQRLVSGEKINFIEFPIVPKGAGDFAVERELKAPEPVDKNFECLLADVTEMDVEWPKAQWILTPWLIDVVDMHFPAFVSRLNSALPIGGHWINYGPLGFNNPQLQDYYSFEEVNHIVQKMGFKILNSTYDWTSYMQSPSSNSHRNERVYCFVAEKVSEASLSGQDEDSFAKIEDDDLDQIIDVPIQEMRLEEAFLFNAKVAKLLKGQSMSINQLTDQLMSEVPISREHLIVILRQMIMNFKHQSLRNPLDYK